MARRLLFPSCMNDRTEEKVQLVPLSKHVHFARALAGLPRVALGIAAGATLFTMAGCGMSCNGSYGAIPPPQHDAMVDHGHADAHADGGLSHATPALGTDAGHGGGPTLAPPLPTAWV
jgi:hypothetical protein